MSLDPFYTIGCMSGTSLDGLDICFCSFALENNRWSFQIIKGETIPYPSHWTKRLVAAYHLPGSELKELSVQYARFCAKAIDDFLTRNAIPKEKINLVAQHGHTVFHQPDKGYTLQIGCEADLAAQLGLTVVTDFRSQDVALGGQGAPLVPIGDEKLFGDYSACLNLGGFANISFTHQGERVAFDICPVNFVTNPQARRLGHEYDDRGKIAAKSKVDGDLLEKLNHLAFYKKGLPKSLGQEWVEQQFNPCAANQTAETLLATYTEHAAQQIAAVLNKYQIKNCLISGGGALNDELLRLIKTKTDCKISVAPNEILHFKEALIFAFMGILKLRGEKNVLASVTGASKNHSSGVVYNT